MKFLNLLDEKNALIPITAENKDGAIGGLVTALAKAGKIESGMVEKAGKAVLEREKAISTALGLGVALPHAKLASLDEFVVGVGRLENEIAYEGAADPVRILVLILSPASRTVDHVKLMADITKMLKYSYVRQAILDAKSAAEVLQALSKESEE